MRDMCICQAYHGAIRTPAQPVPHASGRMLDSNTSLRDQYVAHTRLASTSHGSEAERMFGNGTPATASSPVIAPVTLALTSAVGGPSAGRQENSPVLLPCIKSAGVPLPRATVTLALLDKTTSLPDGAALPIKVALERVSIVVPLRPDKKMAPPPELAMLDEKIVFVTTATDGAAMSMAPPNLNGCPTSAQDRTALCRTTSPINSRLSDRTRDKAAL
jgi:hypothetical protein